MEEKNVKITIMKKNDSLVEFLAQADFNNDTNIYTEIPIDENSEFVDWDEGDEKYQFYSTSLGYLIERYKAVSINEIRTHINIEEDISLHLSEDLFPVSFKGKDYYENDCSDLYLSVYHSKMILNDLGGVYLSNGNWVYPDGSIEEY